MPPGGGADIEEITEQVIEEHLKNNVPNYDTMSQADKNKLQQDWAKDLQEYPNRKKEAEEEKTDIDKESELKQSEALLKEISTRAAAGGDIDDITGDVIDNHLKSTVAGYDSMSAADKQKLQEEWQERLRRYPEEKAEFDAKKAEKKEAEEDKQCEEMLSEIGRRAAVNNGADLDAITEQVIDEHLQKNVKDYDKMTPPEKAKLQGEWQKKLEEYPAKKAAREAAATENTDTRTPGGRAVKCGIFSKISNYFKEYPGKAAMLAGGAAALGAAAYPALHAFAVANLGWAGSSLGASFAATTIAGVSLAAVAPAAITVAGVAVAAYGVHKAIKALKKGKEGEEGKIAPEEGKGILSRIKAGAAKGVTKTKETVNAGVAKAKTLSSAVMAKLRQNRSNT